MDNSKLNELLKKDKAILKFKKNKANTVIVGDKNFEFRKKLIKEEIKKIKQFKKMLTRNSKVFTKKYGKEIIEPNRNYGSCDGGEKNKFDNNSSNSINIKLFKKKKTEIRNSKFVKNNITNKNNNKNNNNNNKNINIKKYSLKNINVNIINSFQLINNEKIKRRNSCILLYKLKPVIKQTNHNRSYNNFSFSSPNVLSPKEINPRYKFKKKNIKYDLNSFQIKRNISINYKKSVKNENKQKNKLSNDIKIGFYSLLVKSLLEKRLLDENSDFEKKEKKEEEKRRFLLQLFYCLELSKIYILNFKQNKLSSSKSLLPIISNKSSKSLKTGDKAISKEMPKFKPFYKIFSDFSQIKVSTQEKYEAYPNIEHINQYFIFKDKQIGKGGSSVVYLGEDEKQKKYAIKVTPKNLKANPFKNIYDYVKEEVSILKRIHSKYIVTTYEVIESRNKIYIIMEYMSAGSVINILEFMDEKKIKKYTRDLICAVEHCHEIANVIHKDINVNNILINQDGEAKLSDFGISETFEDNNDLLLSKGPSTYTPPEKKCKEKYKGKPADIYLIGLTLFHLVFKKPLFTDFGNLTTKDYMNIVIPKIDNKKREINNNLHNLLESLLKFNPEERPTIEKLKKDPWLTDNMKNPFPDVIKEALFYSLELTKRQIKELNEEGDEKDKDSSNINEDEIKIKNNIYNEDNSSDNSDSSSSEES